MSRVQSTEMTALEFSKLAAEGKLDAEQIEIGIYNFMKVAEKKGRDDVLAPLFKMHGQLATALVTDEITDDERTQLESIRRALDIIEAAQ